MRLFVDSLTNVDFSYLCPIRGIVGETWLANVELVGELDDQGMVCDFGVVKKVIRGWLDHHLDHRLLVPARNSDVEINQVDDQLAVSMWLPNNSRIDVSAPSNAITLIELSQISSENVSKWCETQLKKEFGKAVAQVKLTFSTEAIDTPYYHYSHGLKKHAGDCQRIAHGHRSKLFVWRNGVLCNDTMQHWASTWRDIYIGTKEDCINDDGTYCTFQYTSTQGFFKIRLPKSMCYVIDTDSTVELIGRYLATRISEHHPKDRIVVKAFEGIGKGAIVEIQPQPNIE